MSTKRQKRERKQAQLAKENERSTLISFISFFIIAFLFFLWGSWLLPITDPVESNYALTAREMVESGDWISPQIYDHWPEKLKAEARLLWEKDTAVFLERHAEP